jgi:hypothetical protein
MRKQGKKIDILEIKHGAHTHKVELRLDKNNGEFSAELGNEHFVSRDLGELTKLLRAQAAQMASYEFRWWIDIRLSFSANGVRRSSYGVDFVDLNPDELCQLGFSFEVYERSQLISTDDAGWLCRLERQLVDVDGALVPENRGVYVGDAARAARGEADFRRVTVREGQDDDVSIEYTPERYAKLCAIRRGLYELARRLNEVVGDSNKAAAALDGAPLLQLLPVRDNGDE